MAKKKKEKKEAAEHVLSRREQLSTVMCQINAVLNAEIPKSEWRSFVNFASDVVSPFMLRRPSGIMSLDLATKGGFPAGGLMEIAGPSGVGKNALCLQTIAECQRIYGDDACIGWCPTELPFDKPFAHMMGVAVPMSDIEIAFEEQARVELNLPSLTKIDIEERKRAVGSFTIVDTGSTAKRLDAVAEMVRSNLFQIIVIDSLAAILTGKRDDTPLDEYAQQSSEAFLLTEWLKKLLGAYDPMGGVPKWTTLIATNQARAKRNTKSPFDRAWQIGGAWAVKHGKLGSIVLVGGEQIQGSIEAKDDPEDVTPKKRKVTLGKKVKWEIAKGKAGFHEGPRGIVEYHFDSGFQVEKDLIDTAIDQQVIVKLKPSIYGVISPEGEVVEEVRGKQQLYVKACDIDWFHRVYTYTLRKANITCLSRL